MKSILLLILCFTTTAHAERWDANNNPYGYNFIVGGLVITKYDLLPLNGRLSDERFAWSETYWPSNKGGIAYRWNQANPMPFDFTFYTKAELQTMTKSELEKLSPAELYDISQGDYEYTLTKSTLNLFKPQALWWEGICHGWAQAAANYPEPEQVVITNPDGIKVPFGSSDVKGLLAMHDAHNSIGYYTHIGGRCKASGKIPGEARTGDEDRFMPETDASESVECRDVNAGAFHIVMANMIGIHSQSFVADIDRFSDVWNQPIVGYESRFLRELSVEQHHYEAGVARRFKMAMKMTYSEELQFRNQSAINRGEINFVSKLPVTRTPHQEFRTKDYEYILELDNEENIIGGEWISKTRPDFLWSKTRDLVFWNMPLPLGGLNQIYKPVKY